MRYSLLLIPLATLAAPAFAAPPPQTQQIQIPPELTDPATAEKLANMMQSLSRAFLDLPIGEVQAAAEGRQPTAEERRLTVRDMGRRDDPDFERNLDRQIAQSKPMIEHSLNALARALPAMTRSLSNMARQMERATANMPRPDYPRR
jgi:hypothetical protein